MSNFDIVIKTGKIIDGTGNPGFHTDMGIKDGKITKIGHLGDVTTTKELDADGMVVSPGFIDIHSHSDFTFPYDNRLESTLRQGITTLVIGNCGDSLAPIHPEKKDELAKLIEIFGPPGETLDITWLTFDEYLTEMEQKNPSTNIAALVGFGAIRIAGGPGHEDREPTPEELDSMKKYAEEAMKSGAFGMSTGLIYPPQVYSKTDEIIEIAKVVGEYNGLYFSHIRNEGAEVIKAINELIEIVEKSGCVGGHIAHHKVSGERQWGLSKETLRLMEEANDRGINVTCDQYPYNRGMTSLVTLLPPWAHIGGMEKIMERLQSPEDRERMKKDIIEGIEGWESFHGELGSEHIYIATVKTEKWKDIESKHLAEITKIKGKPDVFTTLFDMLLDENAAVSMTIESMGEEDINRIMTGRFTMVGTDGSGVSPTGVLGYGKPHPRFYGTYPRILGKYVREKGVLKIEDAIRKMSSFPAQRLGLLDRGLLREGMWADVVVFDPKTVIDRATFLDPHQFPIGIKHVLVNGKIVVEDDYQTKELPGKILRRNRTSHRVN